ncbi:methyl-accepting chemotaxis protein [Pseudomarimonas salicorniae]|uniref:methyl-accepting chemotaxis protein n=1 Tax=Pseudomarimonas salicorniae TaxID=2933270 RepID=UPI00249EC89C|nr:methyl-accepting chemotaxis protein [Lysobacter sp. CAU 1642]
MNFLNNLKLQPRLFLAFGVVMLLTLILGFAGLRALGQLNEDADSLASNSLVGVETAGTLANIAARHRLQTFQLIVPSAAAVKDRARESQATYESRFDDVWARYAATPVEEGEAQARETAMSAWEAFKAQAKEVDEIVQAEFLEEATDMAIGDGSKAYSALAEALDQIAAIKGRAATAAVAKSQSTYTAARGTMITVLVVSILLSLLFAFIVARSVVNGVRASLGVVNDIANGRLDGSIDTSRQDEVGELNRGMAKMQDTLRSFARAETEMAEQHEAGQLDYRIEASQFTGAYRDMATSLNELVASQIETMNQAVALMRRYAVGDLSQDMVDLPGQKAAITEAMVQTKANLQSVNAEIQRLVLAAADGDFSIRGDEQQFQFAFREMVAGLNQLMQQADSGLGEVGKLLLALSQGDLTVRVENRFKGAFFNLVENANSTVERLTDIARKITQASEEINVAAGEIAAGNSDLSERTEQQAANLEETASSMEELTSTVKQNAENSRQARQLAVGAADVASRGGEVVGRVVTTMDAISASSKRIEDIISVIDGIAFQTNILALNAAVEAARAGEQGRGFAVVASEVRSLAQRSADAAKEIKELIAESVITVTEGSTLVHDAGKTMDEIMSSVKRVTDIMSEIAAASDEQSSGIEQVNQTVVQMDQTTQQNAALVEQASAAARSMEEQAGELATAVSVFRLPGGADARTAKPAAKESVSGPGLQPRSVPGSARPPTKEAGKPAPGKDATGRPAAPAKPAAKPASPPQPAPSKPAATPKPVGKSGPGKADEHHWEEF